FIPVAEGLEAAHAQRILHRDIKPANLLVRRVREPGASATGGRWQVKVIDFGLAMKRTLLEDTPASGSARNLTVVGESIAGTVQYGAPEQMGQLPGVAVGPYTDVYAFGKTCCHALFKTTTPLPKHWRSLPAPLADLLEQCLNERPEERFPGFGE